jgi:Flp pilus assembly protein TadG
LHAIERKKIPQIARTNGQTRIDVRKGVAAIEFAIIANVLFILVMASFEIARLNLARNLAQDAAYYAARQAMVPGATDAEAHEEAKRILASMFDRGYQVKIHPLGHESERVMVEVSINLKEVAFFAPMFLPNKSITSVASLKTERYRGFYRHPPT